MSFWMKFFKRDERREGNVVRREQSDDDLEVARQRLRQVEDQERRTKQMLHDLGSVLGD